MKILMILLTSFSWAAFDPLICDVTPPLHCDAKRQGLVFTSTDFIRTDLEADIYQGFFYEPCREFCSHDFGCGLPEDCITKCIHAVKEIEIPGRSLPKVIDLEGEGE